TPIQLGVVAIPALVDHLMRSTWRCSWVSTSAARRCIHSSTPTRRRRKRLRKNLLLKRRNNRKHSLQKRKRKRKKCSQPKTKRRKRQQRLHWQQSNGNRKSSVSVTRRVHDTTNRFAIPWLWLTRTKRSRKNLKGLKKRKTSRIPPGSITKLLRDPGSPMRQIPPSGMNL